MVIIGCIPLDGRNSWDLDLVPQLFIKDSSGLDVRGPLVIWIGIDLQSVEGFDANVDVFRESLNDPKTLGKRSAALELKR